MGLAKLQSELAALLMEPPRFEAFARNPKAFARNAGLTGRDAELLAGLPVEGVRYFAQRRRIDRLGYLRADLPHSVSLLDREAGVAAYFAAHPYAFEEPMKEVARFARWVRSASRMGAVPHHVADAVTVEATAVLLMHGAHRPAKRRTRPCRAPGVRVLRVGHDPEHFLHDHPWTPKPGAHTVVLQRTADDVEMPVLKPLEVVVLRAANGRRTRAQLTAHLVAKGHSGSRTLVALARLRRLGLVECL